MTDALTVEQTAALDQLLESWKEDDNASYGWEGPAEGPEFVDFWLAGEGYRELGEIVRDEERDAAVAYLKRKA